MEAHKDAIVNMAIESWRFARLFERLLTKLDAGEHKRYTGQLKWFIKKTEESLDQVGLQLVNVEGHPYDPGMAATPLNMEDFDSDDDLIVNQMLEPIIMEKEKGTLVKTGTVILRRAG